MSTSVRPKATEPGRPPTVGGTVLRLLLASVFLGLSLVGATAEPAAAHAVLVDSSPRDGSRLDDPPNEVQLHFDEPVRVLPDTAQVINSAGDRVDVGRARSADSGRTVIIGLNALPDQPDSYLVSWQVTSVDSHPVSGSLQFGVRQAPDLPTATAATDAPSRPLAALATAGSALTYAGLVIAVGCPAVVLLVWPSARRAPRLPSMITIGTAAVGIGTLAELIIDAITIAGPDRSPALFADAVAAVAGTGPGLLLIARMIFVIVLALISLSWLTRPLDRPRFVSWLLLATGLLITTAAHGHALASPRWPITVLATAAHLAGMCCWIGGVVALVLLVAPRLRSVPAALSRAVAPWSRFAFGCVATLIISGELLAWRQVQPVEALWQTRYGVILLIKLVLVAIAVLLGRATSQRLGRTHPVRRVKILLGTEITVGCLIIVAASVLSATPAATDTYGPPATVATEFDHGELIVEVASTRRGPQQVTVTPRTAAGEPLDLADLTGRLSSPEAGVSALDVHFVRSGDSWRSTDATAVLPGRWTLQLTARPGSGPAYVTSVAYRVW